MAQPALSFPDWSLLPEELLNIVSEKLEDGFDVIHARSVCRSWRSIFPFPSRLLRTRYSLPSFDKLPRKGKGFCTFEKFPMFLFGVRAPAAALCATYFLGGVDQDKSEEHMELPFPIQCSVKVKIQDFDPTLMNILDCQILPLGYLYRMVGWNPELLTTKFRGVAFLPLNKGGEFVVLLGYYHDLFVLRSVEMRWTRLERVSTATCKDIVTFRGRFYVVFLSGEVFVFDPYSLEPTPLTMPMELVDCGSVNYLVPSGNDELYLVEVILPRNTDVLDFSRLTLRVSRLDEEAGEWVEVTHLGDRVLFIGQPENVSCSKELPDGCGISGNSILMTYEPWKVTHPYRYGVRTGREEDEINCWRFSTENRVTILGTSPVVALQVER
ncbi:hypothetical protein EUTSA_v10000199mg [Eutrema salsugineum]|uniref:F-box domain-containing protein n=2 Tax=Eutrema salsugineum TaxID=72664 RepID=V4LVH5_EUTSA|nr:hypothetical protein EUTSA_v10000199mg [Eutrema salsugineum]